MSRVGVVPVAVPSGVKVEAKGNRFAATGPKGSLQLQTTGNISVTVEDSQVTVTRGDNAQRNRALHGLYRKLIANMVTGVSTGFSKVLVINGVGYRAEVKGSTLVLNLGYSNAIEYPIRDGVTVDAAGGTRITVSGADRQVVGQVAAEIRAFRPPEPYKGKGVRYENEFVRRKAGKAMGGTA
ncbi:MAG: 50S ribosomal protein L6 [Spirochaetaceae bacterium]|nr:50S ribosomal protein L6 [Spirochaetaceae bacterium]MDE0446692.1 50S ribosomal protein L6 [Spirochaetaceae bacterium]